MARAQAEQRVDAPGGIHYAWVVVALTFMVLLVAAGVRNAASVLIKPLELEFGWTRSQISLAISVSLLTFGLGGPLGGTLIERWGTRRVMLTGLALIALGLAPLTLIRELWQLHLFWGIFAGIGTGMVATVLGATVASRWFKTRRGLVLGLFSAASSAGQLIFLPVLLQLSSTVGWRTAIWTILAAVVALVLPIAIWMRNRPQDVGLRAVGELSDDPDPQTGLQKVAMLQVVRTPDFWLLASSFFICGYTSNGMIGTHLLPHALEHGFTETVAAGALALMGVMNMVGSLSSGWLTDRYDSRKLLACYYGFRALSLGALPWVNTRPMLLVFAVFYGLDWIATVPPTVALTSKIYGKAAVGPVFGWIFCAHMFGAALAAYVGGALYDALQSYNIAFWSSAALGFIAVALSLRIARRVLPMKRQASVV